MNAIFSNIVLTAALMLTGCGSSETRKTEAEIQSASAATPQLRAKFRADSAYENVRRQVEMGPRVPGSEAHRRCAEFLANELARHGCDTVIVQNAIVSAFNGDELPISNIMGRFNVGNNRRILLVAHYDSRPWADNEDKEADRHMPVDGANDGASGVGVLLEIARVLGAERPDVGVDLLLVDAEDYGDSSGFSNQEDTWCLGTQYWVQHMPYGADNRPIFGMVLDMVGGTNARFHREYYSNQAAPSVVSKVWGIAAREGFSKIFIDEVGGSIIDDHVFINRAGIPCIDIIECNNALTHSFPPTWHTRSDNMSSIDQRSLQAVGKVVMAVIDSESSPR